MMVTKLQKWGNSQGLRLSRQVLDLAGLDVGDQVEIIVKEHQILVKKLPRPRVDLAELVARIPKKLKIAEVNMRSPVGREEW